MLVATPLLPRVVTTKNFLNITKCPLSVESRRTKISCSRTTALENFCSSLEDSLRHLYLYSRCSLSSVSLHFHLCLPGTMGHQNQFQPCFPRDTSTLSSPSIAWVAWDVHPSLSTGELRIFVLAPIIVSYVFLLFYRFYTAQYSSH